MRTTLSLDEDVQALLDRVRRLRNAGLKEVVNEALRTGLRSMLVRPKPRKQRRTRSVSLGKCLAGSLDDVAGALAVAEGETFK